MQNNFLSNNSFEKTKTMFVNKLLKTLTITWIKLAIGTNNYQATLQKAENKH